MGVWGLRPHAGVKPLHPVLTRLRKAIVFSFGWSPRRRTLVCIAVTSSRQARYGIKLLQRDRAMLSR
jgi:hypothetical protein